MSVNSQHYPKGNIVMSILIITTNHSLGIFVFKLKGDVCVLHCILLNYKCFGFCVVNVNIARIDAFQQQTNVNDSNNFVSTIYFSNTNTKLAFRQLMYVSNIALYLYTINSINILNDHNSFHANKQYDHETLFHWKFKTVQLYLSLMIMNND